MSLLVTVLSRPHALLFPMSMYSMKRISKPLSDELNEFKYFFIIYDHHIDTLILNCQHSNLLGREYTCRNIFQGASFGAPRRSGGR